MTTRQIHAFAQLIDQLPIGVHESEVIDGAVADNSVKSGFTPLADAPHVQHSGGGFGACPSHRVVYGDAAPSLRTGESLTGFAGYATPSWNGKSACCSAGSLGASPAGATGSNAHPPDSHGNYQLAYTHNPCMDATGVYRGCDRDLSGNRVGDCGDSMCGSRAPVFDGKGPGNKSAFPSDPASSPSSAASSSTQADVASYMPSQHRLQQTVRGEEYCSATSHGSSPVADGSSTVSMHPVYPGRNDGDRDHYRVPAYMPANAPFNARDIGPCSGGGCTDCAGASAAHSISQRDGALLGVPSGNGDVVDHNGLHGWAGSRRPSHSSWVGSSTCCTPPSGSTGFTGHGGDGSSLVSAQAGVGGLNSSSPGRGGSAGGPHQGVAGLGWTQRVRMSSSPSGVSEREKRPQGEGICGNGKDVEGTLASGGCCTESGSSWAGGSLRPVAQDASSGFGQASQFGQNLGTSLPQASRNAPMSGPDPATGDFLASGAAAQNNGTRRSTTQHGSSQECSVLNVGVSVSSSSASTFEGHSSCGSSGSQNGSPPDSPRARSTQHGRHQAAGRALVHRRVSGASVGAGIRGEATLGPAEFSKSGQHLPSEASKSESGRPYDKLGGQLGGCVITEKAERKLGVDGQNTVGGGSGRGEACEGTSSKAPGSGLWGEHEGGIDSGGGSGRSAPLLAEEGKAIAANGARLFPLGNVKESEHEEVVNLVDAATGAAHSSLCVDREALLPLTGDRQVRGAPSADGDNDVAMPTSDADSRGHAEVPNHVISGGHSQPHMPDASANLSRLETDRVGDCGGTGAAGDSRVLSTRRGSGASDKGSQNLPTGKGNNLAAVQPESPLKQGKEGGETSIWREQGSGQPKKHSDETNLAGKEQGEGPEMAGPEQVQEVGDAERARLSAVIRTLEEELNKVTEELREVVCQREDGREFFQKAFLDRKTRYLYRLQEIRPFLGASFDDIVRAVTACRTVGQLSTWVLAFDFAGAAVAPAADVASRVLEVFNSGAAAPLHVAVDRRRSVPQLFRSGSCGVLDWDTGRQFGTGMRWRNALSSSPAGSPSSRTSCVRGAGATSVGRHADTSDNLLGFRSCTSRSLCPDPSSFTLRAPSLHAESHLLPFPSVPGDEAACGVSRVSDSPLGVQAERSAGEMIRNAMRTRVHETNGIASHLLASGDAGARHLTQPPRARLCSLGDSVGEEEDGLHHRFHPSLGASSPMDVFSRPGGLVDSIHKGLSPRTSSIDDPVSGRAAGSSSTLYVPFIGFECGRSSSPASASRSGAEGDQVFWPSATSAPRAEAGAGANSAREDAPSLACLGGEDARAGTGSSEDSRGGGATGGERAPMAVCGASEKGTKKQAGDGGGNAAGFSQGAAEEGSEVDDATAPGSPLFEKGSRTDGASIEMDVCSNQHNQNDADASGSPCDTCEELSGAWPAGDGTSFDGKSAHNSEGNRDFRCAGPSGETEGVAGMGDTSDAVGSVNMCFVPFPQLNNCAGQGGQFLNSTAGLNGAESNIFGSQMGQLDWGHGSYRLQKLIASQQLR
ncbi:conserved hypothetical protein [Neospora caninum Liverpool]|uniref:Uncharacterized protein n=1 Tax=Neospora caninum (strain Liverpool) TaxID=572307 RepID=F0VHT5_NEOCL|nr:conserved hypothetical protein [Neospora caninum Liverpool]CBZ53296.1 conserved hypothetical protein [Neospora caninum Liverpool]|eukprot:XP_003883328.1 conserved hypothetical protein [Neospora caninum Liverpool]